MIKPIHDTTNKLFRDPAGAVPAGSSVRFGLVLTGGEDQNILFNIRFDKDSSVTSIPMKLAGSVPGGVSYTVCFTPHDKGLYWYWFDLSSEDSDDPAPCIGCDPASGHASFTSDPHAWQLTVFEPSYADPDWIQGGVFYHIFVDRFARGESSLRDDVFGPRLAYCREKGKIMRSDWGGMPEYLPDPDGEILNNDFFGGDLAGIREKLPYLESLGVTCLYISPIFEAYSSHKYDTADYMKIDPMFGDEDEFRELCSEAFARGIRIICDGVFSHTGSFSRYFDVKDWFGDGAYHHPDSPYRDWYYFEPDGYQTWWGIRTLPRVNKDCPSYQDFITGPDGVVRHWLRAGASGWRLDVVDELPSSFLEKLTASAKTERPDSLILGEVWEDASNKIAYEERKNYFEGDKLDSVMNYPLRRALIDFVRGGDAEGLASVMKTIMDHYPLRVVHSLMNILGTHDTERILTALGGEILPADADRSLKAATVMSPAQRAVGIARLKTAVVLQMTLPGVPCIYYGDEAGMEGYADPFNRVCYPWGHEDDEVQSWYRLVLGIRREHSVYRDGSYRLLAAKNGLFAFERGTADPVQVNGRSGMITAANCGEEPQTLHLFGSWTDLLTGDVLRDDIFILPGQAMILEPSSSTSSLL